MNQNVITWISPSKLRGSDEVSNLYSIPENYESMRENISKVGILTPLHVIEGVVVSGNLRLRIAKELGLKLVPVIYLPKQNISAKLMAVCYGQQRIKKYSEILKEYEILEAEYPVGKGCRTDLNPQMKKNAEKKKSLNISKDKIYKLKSIKALAKELYGEETNSLAEIWSQIDSEKTSLSSIEKGLKREKAIRENNRIIPSEYELMTDRAKVYNKSCENMSELADKSIACIMTSPPYFGMRDYGTGTDQRGLEKDINEYIKGLLNDFKDCYRVLKDDGSLWVNINEPVIDGEYHSISHQFVMAMRKEGWKLNDEIIWIKNNPVFTQAKRAVRSHEYIFHFVKSSKYNYDVSWLRGLTDPNDLISYGTAAKMSNLISGMDFRDTIIRTNGNNMNGLRKACKEQGFNLTHSAGYPISIPLIAILTSSKVGDTILDIYSGTATTGEAALATKRKYVGYEIKPEFVMASKVRLDNYVNEELYQAA
jgi:site-specific DNA-methyltransferase (adenine-specific)